MNPKNGVKSNGSPTDRHSGLLASGLPHMKCPSLTTARKTYPGMSKGRYASYKRGWEAADKRLTPARRKRKVTDAV